ncbi:MAG: 1,4-dihydroxy-2-naphthoate polyprenyltransferase [Actinobacteria bacterium]|nr:1,4-dihydroxy-2-naphthoate polyprenyltransferase [Actinomycetota bacterium]
MRCARRSVAVARADATDAVGSSGSTASPAAHVRSIRSAAAAPAACTATRRASPCRALACDEFIVHTLAIAGDDGLVVSSEVWLAAARPRTLPAAISPVLVGTAAATRFVAWRMLAALVVAVAIQVAVNFANDYFDGVRGVDTADRRGPRRAVAAGLVRPEQMRRAMVVALVAAAAAGVALAAAAGWVLVLVGGLCFAAAVGYSGGPRPYASAGLGEVFVFVFFGLVATVGSAYVQDESLRWLPAIAAVPVGLLSVALLVVNNLRDIPTDTRVGKRTVAVRLGERRTFYLFIVLINVAILWTGLVALVALSVWPAMAFGALPLALVAQNRTADGLEADDPALLVVGLAATGRLQLLYGLLLAAGLSVASVAPGGFF